MDISLNITNDSGSGKQVVSRNFTYQVEVCIIINRICFFLVEPGQSRFQKQQKATAN